MERLPMRGRQLPPLLASLATRRAQADSAGKTLQGTPQAPSVPLRKKTTKASSVAGQPKKKAKKATKGAPKGAPKEVSSRRPVRAQTPKQRKAPQPRDPRFDDLSGSLDVDLFRKSYSFLEDYRAEELGILKREVAAMKEAQQGEENEGAAALEQELSKEVRKRVEQDKRRYRLGEVQAAERTLKREEREKVRATGKTPYFHKRGQVRRILMERRVKDRKGLRNKLAEKKEKRAAGREKKRLPLRRRREGET